MTGGMEANNNLVEILTRSETFRSYQRAFTEVTGIPLMLRSAETGQLPYLGQCKEGAFCALMAKQHHSCCAGMQLREERAPEAVNIPVTRMCAYGLCDIAVPVTLGSQTMGVLQTGLVMVQKPTEASFQCVVEQARKLGMDIGDEQTKRAYLATPVVSQKKLDSVSNLLAVFAEHLAIICNQLVMRLANAEPPIIAQAKQFIREHCAQRLSLGLVSSAVHASPFHFCKLFRKATAVHFTEFVARARIEKARNLLPNPNLRINEIAFDSGFQSSGNFNRVFKNIMGQSPTEYRGKLLAAG